MFPFFFSIFKISAACTYLEAFLVSRFVLAATYLGLSMTLGDENMLESSGWISIAGIQPSCYYNNRNKGIEQGTGNRIRRKYVCQIPDFKQEYLWF